MDSVLAFRLENDTPYTCYVLLSRCPVPAFPRDLFGLEKEATLTDSNHPALFFGRRTVIS